MQPCDPPKSRVTGGGCHRGGFLEAGLKLVVSNLYSVTTTCHRGGFLEAGLKHTMPQGITHPFFCHRGGFLEAGLKRRARRWARRRARVTEVDSWKRV